VSTADVPAPEPWLNDAVLVYHHEWEGTADPEE
jgi:hypothetical protein